MIRSGMEKLFEFGTHEHSLVGNIKNIFSAFSVVLIWTMLMSIMLRMIVGLGAIEISSIITAKMSVYNSVPVNLMGRMWLTFFLACIFAPLWEEVAFRYVPLRIAKSLEIMIVRLFPHSLRRNRGVEYDHERGLLYGNLRSTSFIFPVMLLSSIVFGQAHGSVMNILFQGVGGFVFSWLMVKSGYWPAVMAHGMWNFMLMFGMPIVLS